MSSHFFFANNQDSGVLLDWLNTDKEIAFIIQDLSHEGSQRKWKATHVVDRWTEEKYCLWHIPGGSLPLLRMTPDPYEPIADPWSGWLEQRPAYDALTPYFGGHPAEISLEIHPRHQPYTATERMALRRQNSLYMGDTDILPLSSLRWGNRYSTPSQQTWQWWQKLTEWMLQNATLLKKDKEITEKTNNSVEHCYWSFPSASEKLKSGIDYYAPGYGLENAIRKLKSGKS
jgi:hypothetical protein